MVAFDTQVMPDGTSSSFSIPEGSVLVITSFDWSSTAEPNQQCGPNGSWIEWIAPWNSCPYGTVRTGMGIAIDNGTQCVTGGYPAANAIRATAPADSFGSGEGDQEIPTGVVVRLGATDKLCLGLAGARIGGTVYGTARLHGFLTKDR
jgi:hypothetical protein